MFKDRNTDQQSNPSLNPSPLHHDQPMRHEKHHRNKYRPGTGTGSGDAFRVA
jgi:hypothetical protein